MKLMKLWKNLKKNNLDCDCKKISLMQMKTYNSNDNCDDKEDIIVNIYDPT